MLINVPTVPRKRDKRQARGRALPVGSLTVVGVENITPIEGGLRLTAVFNTSAAFPIDDVSAATAGKWSLRFNDELFTGDVLTLTAYDRLQIDLFVDAVEEGADRLVYTNAPSDIRDTAGRQLAAFEMELA